MIVYSIASKFFDEFLTLIGEEPLKRKKELPRAVPFLFGFAIIRELKEEVLLSKQTQLGLEESGTNILEGLNKEQKKAVKHKDGPLLIIAGAGTGKTTVITKRIAYLISEKIAEPSEILALTFTEKAAAEMEERVDQLVPYGYTDMWISTFHAFGDRLLRDFSLDLGLPINFKILTATEQAIFMRENIFAFDLKHFRPIANPLSHIQALLTHFSRLKDELIDPRQYIEFARLEQGRAKTEEEEVEAEKTLELAQAFERYNDLMIQAGNLDFGDQIFLTYKLLKENKKVLQNCQEKFKYILVDEFQDTNFAQNEIVKLLANKNKNITVVGDDDQSIYRFRGASISNILDFNKSYEKITQIVLNRNYRSTQQILDSSYKLIRHNNPDRLEIQNKIDKKLIAIKTGLEPELLHCDTLSCEADTVAKKIKDLKEERELKYSDFAILVRANSHSEPFIQSLNILGIPHLFSGASGLFSQPEIKMLVAFLKCLAYTDDNLALYQLATSKLYNISHHELAKLYTESKRGHRSSLDLIENDGNASIELKTLLKDLKKYEEKKNEPVGETLYAYLTEKEYLKNLIKADSTENELEIFHISKFFDTIAQFSHTSSERGVLAFLNNLELILEVGGDIQTSTIDPEIDAVNILTAHASKGLEWPVVFIVNCVADRFPGRKKREQLPIPEGLIKERLPEGDFHIQEERRLFYVAATRAKDYLFLTEAEDYGGKRAKKISQFALELLDEAKPEKLKQKLSLIEKIERFKKIEKEPIKLSNDFTAETLRLSRQQIDDYYTCPKKFYFAHVVKIPLLENHYLMYGTAIHAALGNYFSRKIRKEQVSLKQLLADFEQSFKNVGFITVEHEKQRYNQGIETLTRFYGEDQTANLIPSEVETPFEFAEAAVKVRGRYDVLFKASDSTEIGDFKTSEVKDQKDADKRIKQSTQMKIYALAWYEKYKEIPKTTLHFIESGLKGEATFKLSELEETKEMILEAVDGIKKQDMTAKPDKHQCSLCPYKEICPEAV